jgi:exodeoxyribonuclease V gamma subunit
MLPGGRLGLAAWTAERDAVNALLRTAQAHPLFAGALPQRQPYALSLAVGEHAVEGVLERVFVTDDALWLFDAWPGKKAESLTFAQRVPLFLEWALLRLAADTATPVRVAVFTADEQTDVGAPFNAWDEALLAADPEMARAMREALAARVDALLAIWRQAQRQPLPYFPRTSWAALDDKPDAARQAWEGGFNAGERDYAPGYARLLAGEANFADGQPPHAELQALALRLAHLIDPATLGEVDA